MSDDVVLDLVLQSQYLLLLKIDDRVVRFFRKQQLDECVLLGSDGLPGFHHLAVEAVPFSIEYELLLF